MPDLHQTSIGIKFFEKTMPRIAKALERIAKDTAPQTIYIVRQASTGTIVAVFKDKRKATQAALQAAGIDVCVVEPWTFNDEDEEEE